MSCGRNWIVALSLLALAAGTCSCILTALQSPAAPMHPSPALQAGSRPGIASPSGGVLGLSGCDADAHIESGKQIEPRALPDQPVSTFRKIYGKEASRNEFGPLTWNLPGYSLRDDYFNNSKTSQSVNISVKTGHTLKTIDGIELGVDTFATVLKKLRTQSIEVNESMDGPEGNWMLYVSFYSPCSRKFRSEYSWFIAGSPKIDRQIIPEVKEPANQSPVWRSDIFLHRVVYDYSLAVSNGSDLPVGNQPSTHK